jgi:hypothetical protein
VQKPVVGKRHATINQARHLAFEQFAGFQVNGLGAGRGGVIGLVTLAPISTRSTTSCRFPPGQIRLKNSRFTRAEQNNSPAGAAAEVYTAGTVSHCRDDAASNWTTVLPGLSSSTTGSQVGVLPL